MSLTKSTITERLFDRYYGDAAGIQESEFVSSHWIEEGAKLQAANQGEWGIVPTNGSYWGCNWSGTRGRLVDQLSILLHWLPLAHKYDIYRMSRVAGRVCRKMGLDPTYTTFRQVCSVALLRRNLPEGLRAKPLNALVIGDGIGVLSALIKAIYPQSTIALVDIGKTLLFQAYYLQKGYPGCVHAMAEDASTLESVDFVYCPTEQLDLLDNFTFDVAANNNSMQEMNAATISRYFTFMRSHLKADNLFYCCNRERKELVGGEVSEFFSYPWMASDRHLEDGPCPWQRFFFSRSSSGHGPKFLGVRLPFTNYYDGRIIHRLSVLDTAGG